MKRYGEVNNERRNKAGNTDNTGFTQKQLNTEWREHGNGQERKSDIF